MWYQVKFKSSAACMSLRHYGVYQLTFCWRHSLQARFMVVLRRDDDDGRVSPSPSPLSSSSSLEADRLNPRVLVGLIALLAKGCCDSTVVGVVGDKAAMKERSVLMGLCFSKPDVAGSEAAGQWRGTAYKLDTPSSSPGQHTRFFHQLVHVSE